MRKSEYCYACQSKKIETIETIPTIKIAEVWLKTWRRVLFRTCS